MKTAVIYSRVSSIGDRQNTERQIQDLRSYSVKNDFEILNEFSENISGAKKSEERTVLIDCIEFCIANKVDTLFCSELSRIGRDTLQVLKTLDVLHNNKINVFIQNLGINTLNEDKEINPLASIIVTVMAEMAKIERTNIVYRLNSGRENYIKAGGKLGRSVGSMKTLEQKKIEYSKVLSNLRKGISIRNTATLTGESISTVQRLKKEFGI
jgi:DNA invertase Pin-like site-specific DNA recombinase